MSSAGRRSHPCRGWRISPRWTPPPRVAFSNVALSLRGLDEVGNKAFAEWLIEADHTGPLVLNENAALDATGRRVQMAGATVAEFCDGKTRSYRTYFDDASLIEQLVGD